MTLSECNKHTLCVDCKNEKCVHHGDMVADCPVYPAGRSKECEQATSCDDCPWLKHYIEEEREKINEINKIKMDAIKDFVAWYDSEYETYQKYCDGYCKVKISTTVRRYEKHLKEGIND